MGCSVNLSPQAWTFWISARRHLPSTLTRLTIDQGNDSTIKHLLKSFSKIANRALEMGIHA